MSQGRTTEFPPLQNNSREVFLEVARSQRFQQLRSRFRNFAFPMTIAGLASYFTFVVLSIFAVDFMSSPFLGLEGVNVGLVIGFFQFALVWVWTAIYVNYANTKLDPVSAELKQELIEKGAV
ncbi:DUF485 domain-containing protein [Tessaracoccus sp. MC1865]|nr:MULTISPECIES: DUF485 domain-containing protein [unclassified Tessaracoccus]MBB1510077.1 DUF485 domain-containing protein [Tessaracoccus sp. MC1756]QTO36309.1 DUF485 domain-containing protein [Tessaracoccus sp. MC1865]